MIAGGGGGGGRGRENGVRMTAQFGFPKSP